MTSTMKPMQIASNSERAKNLVHGATVQSGTGWPDSAEHVGFVVLDRHGEFLAWSSCFLIAKRSCDQNPNAATVERCSDGALLARAPWGKAGQRKVTKVAA